MISIPVRRPAHRKKEKQINFRADRELLQMIEDLKIAYPRLGKTDIIHEAVKRWHDVEFR